MRHYEDFAVGDVFRYGPYEMTAAEMRSFAGQWDPQPMHTDPEAAEAVHGGLIASGWHTAAVCMRLIVDGFLADTATLGSPGVESLSWPAPVRPGDELSVAVEVTDRRRSESRPAYGLVEAEWEATTGDGTTVLTLETVWFFERREAGSGPPGAEGNR